MAKKIVKVEETKKDSKKNNIDMKKIGNFIANNKDTIEKVVDLVGDSINTKNTKTTKKGKKSTKTKTSKSTSSGSILDLFGGLFK